MASDGVTRRRGALVLGVDDDETNLRLLQGVVDGLGYSFIGATSGPACLRMLYRVKPNLILLDVMMPDLDGYDTCRRIREEFPLLRAPIVFLTALNTADDVARGIGADGDDFLVKPCQPELLRQRINYWVRAGPRGDD